MKVFFDVVPNGLDLHTPRYSVTDSKKIYIENIIIANALMRDFTVINPLPLSSYLSINGQYFFYIMFMAKDIKSIQ